jgi:hypothetical protein
MFSPKVSDLVWIWVLGYTEAQSGLIMATRRVRDREATTREELFALEKNPLLQKHLCHYEYQVLFGDSQLHWASTVYRVPEMTDQDFCVISSGESSWDIITSWIPEER